MAEDAMRNGVVWWRVWILLCAAGSEVLVKGKKERKKVNKYS